MRTVKYDLVPIFCDVDGRCTWQTNPIEPAIVRRNDRESG